MLLREFIIVQRYLTLENVHVYKLYTEIIVHKGVIFDYVNVQLYHRIYEKHISLIALTWVSSSYNMQWRYSSCMRVKKMDLDTHTTHPLTHLMHMILREGQL